MNEDDLDKLLLSALPNFGIFSCSMCKKEKKIDYIHTLHCQHDYCRTCIERYIKIITTQDDTLNVQCPVCSSTLTLEDVDLLLDENLLKLFKKKLSDNDFLLAKKLAEEEKNGQIQSSQQQIQPLKKQQEKEDKKLAEELYKELNKSNDEKKQVLLGEGEDEPPTPIGEHDFSLFLQQKEIQNEPKSPEFKKINNDFELAIKLYEKEKERMKIEEEKRKKEEEKNYFYALMLQQEEDEKGKRDADFELAKKLQEEEDRKQKEEEEKKRKEEAKRKRKEEELRKRMEREKQIKEFHRINNMNKIVYKKNVFPMTEEALDLLQNNQSKFLRVNPTYPIHSYPPFPGHPNVNNNVHHGNHHHHHHHRHLGPVWNQNIQNLISGCSYGQYSHHAARLKKMIEKLQRAGIQVENVMNGRLVKRFAQYFHQMKRQFPNCKLQFAYHGTRKECYDKIIHQGLKVPDGKSVIVRNGSAYGKGIYCSPSPATSLGYLRGGKKLLVIACVLGNPKVRNAGSYRKGQYIRNDSVVSGNGNIIVLFNNAACCPVFSIYYDKNKSRNFHNNVQTFK